MADISDWNRNREMWIRVLGKQTGEGLDHWNRRVGQERFEDEAGLRAWLNEQGVTGYAQTLLVMERFGYPSFITATAGELIDNQYADRPNLRPIYEAIITEVMTFGEVANPARKTYVSLLTPRRTFARVQPTTKTRLEVGLRLMGQQPGGRLRPSTIHESMKWQISFTSVEEIDANALSWLWRAYEEKC